MNSKLFIRNLSWSVTEEQLSSLFNDIGSVISVKIPTRREDNKPRGFAFVEMSSADEASQAIEQLNGYTLDDRDIVIAFQDENHSGNKPTTQTTKNANLFIRNIGYSVSEQDLRHLFEPQGVVLSVKIPTDRDTGEQKSFGFVEMGSADDAENVIKACNNTFLKENNIVIDYQDPNRNKRKPRSNNDYSHSSGYSRRDW